MPSLNELPSNLNRKKLAKALKRLGFSISTKGGKGSHIKLTYTNQKTITIPSSDLNKNVLYYILKEIEEITEITWDEIKKEL